MAAVTSSDSNYSINYEFSDFGENTLKFYAKYSTTEVMDNDGNLYTSMLIGGKRWLLQNLNTTKNRGGSDIPLVTNGTAWTAKVESGLPDVCVWPDFNSSNRDFGLLYNWSAVQQGEVAPAGWRIPTEADWTALFNAVSSACDLISDWSGNCSGGQNSSGFSLFESGHIYQTSEGEQSYWSNSAAYVWGATNVAKSSPAYANLSGVPGGVSFTIYYDTGLNPFLANGFSIRCVKE